MTTEQRIKRGKGDTGKIYEMKAQKRGKGTVTRQEKSEERNHEKQKSQKSKREVNI